MNESPTEFAVSIGAPRPSILVTSDLLLERDSLSRALAMLRPAYTVVPIAPADLDREVAVRRPALVIGTAPSEITRLDVPSWILLQRVTPRAIVCLHGVQSETDDLSLAEILTTIDLAVRTVGNY